MRNQKGIALILALFTMLFMALLVVVFLDTITIDQQIATNQIRDLQAGFIADAGIETAIYELRKQEDKGEYTGTEGEDVEFPSGSGHTYNVSVSGVTDGTITSTGTVFDFSRTIEADFTLLGDSSPYTVKIDTWKEVE